MSGIRGGDLLAAFGWGGMEIFDGAAPVVSSGSTAIDDKILPKVIEVLSLYGKILTFYTDPTGTYDPLEGEVVGSTENSYAVKAIPPYDFDVKYIDGDLVQMGDMLTGIAGSGLTFTPDNGQKVTFDGQTWTVIRVSPIYSGEQVALYIFHLRRQ